MRQVDGPKYCVTHMHIQHSLSSHGPYFHDTIHLLLVVGHDLAVQCGILEVGAHRLHCTSAGDWLECECVALAVDCDRAELADGQGGARSAAREARALLVMLLAEVARSPAGLLVDAVCALEVGPDAPGRIDVRGFEGLDRIVCSARMKQQQQNDERQSVNGSEVQDSWQCEDGTWQQEIPALLRKLSMLFPTYLQG